MDVWQRVTENSCVCMLKMGKIDEITGTATVPNIYREFMADT